MVVGFGIGVYRGWQDLRTRVTDCREKKGGKAAREPVDNEPIERFDRDPCLNEVARRIGMRRQDCAGEAMGAIFILPAQPLGPRGIRKRGWMVRGEKIVEKLDTCLGWFVVLAIRSREIENRRIGYVPASCSRLSRIPEFIDRHERNVSDHGFSQYERWKRVVKFPPYRLGNSLSRLLPKPCTHERCRKIVIESEGRLQRSRERAIPPALSGMSRDPERWERDLGVQEIGYVWAPRRCS
jgi:hypothetical protein